jgi:ferritin-like metal-binding protein YciE
MKIKSMNDLLIHELKDIYSAEKQLMRALPKMANAVSSPDLQQALEDHLEETKVQAQRLEKILTDMDIGLRVPKCEAMEGLIEEGKKLLEEDMEEQLLDAAIIAACQRVEHYEMAAYGCARTFAEILGKSDIVEILQTSLDEEGNADKKLTEIAMSQVNEEAAGGEAQDADMETEEEEGEVAESETEAEAAHSE